MFSKPVPKLPEPTLPSSGSIGAQRELSTIKGVNHEPTECRALFESVFLTRNNGPWAAGSSPVLEGADWTRRTNRSPEVSHWRTSED